MTVLVEAALGVTVAASLLLLAFGVNLLFLAWRSLRVKPLEPPAVVAGREPAVCVQLPVYNERYVAERVIDAACELDWPRERLTVQVLDDSDDETVGVVARRVASWRRRGFDVIHVRRPERSGYKAGALAHGCRLTEAAFLAVFDADFVPPQDFLRRTIGAFADGKVAFVQARWGHLNAGYSWITRLQALSIDFHFLVEQAARTGGGFFTNFAGTAGVWRRAAVEAAGGWSGDTLTEDFDLSYRAQLAGWRGLYVEDLVVPEELPVSVDGFRRQQRRWATGIFQCALRLGPRLFSSRLSAGVKWQAAMHMSSYLAPVLMLVQLACFPILLYGHLARSRGLDGPSWLLLLNLMSLAPVSAFIAAQLRRGRSWWLGLGGVLCQVVGAGLALTCLTALARSLTPGGVFERTPKFKIERPQDEWLDRAYAMAGDPAALAELIAGAFALAVAAAAVLLQDWLIAFYAGLIGAGFLLLGGGTLVQALELLAVRHLGGRALAGLRGAVPLLLLLVPPALLLGAYSLLPVAFEDSYQHWLAAANLVVTGHLADPLFGMEDSWLPGYQVLAAAVLTVFGWHNLAALQGLDIALALATLALLPQLATSRRQGRIAVLLAALNPVFLLTATEVVAEPLLALALTAATAAALAGRLRLAALCAGLAILSGTKAWLWLVIVAGVYVLDGAAGTRLPRLRPALAWVAPALLLLAVIEAGFAPAAHSVARAAEEVSSAGARGSLPLGPMARAAEFLRFGGIGLAPLLLLAPLGAAAEMRSAAGRTRVRLLHLPAALYLAAIVVLVTAGFYSGSHRYLYLAVPSLALLSAAAVDRLAAPAGVLLVAAAGLLTIAYVPVATSLGEENRGLVAAGQATRSYDGALLTDSPVAAFASGRPPGAVVGSRQLPEEYGAAIAWLRSHRVSTLVLEDIDYYRASTVLHGPASGSPQAPLQAVGPQAAYNVPGGKTAYVYALPPERFCAWLGSSALVDLDPSGQPAAGKSANLQKGAVLEAPSGAVLTGEGMGFGVPIVQYPDGWVYSRTANTVDLSGNGTFQWRKTFELDELGVDDSRSFRPIVSRGEVVVTYTAEGDRLRIQVRSQGLAPGVEQLVILNEQSAAFDDFADATQTRTGTAVGSWTPVGGDWGRLRSAQRGIEWSQPALSNAGFYAAREVRTPDIDFAGLEYVFGANFAGADYTITVQKAR